MRKKISAAVLARAGLLAAGAAVAFLPRQLWNSIILPAEVAADCVIVFLAFRPWAPRAPWWRAAALALLAGDTLYLVNHNFPALAGRTFGVSEFIFSVFITAALVHLWGLFRSARPPARDKVLFAGFAAAAAALSCKFVLFPYLGSGNYHALFYRLNSSYFRLTEACALALAVLLCARTYSRYWLFVLHGFILISIASLALGYNDGVLLGMEVPFHEYGWFWGLLLIIAGQSFRDHSALDLARWASMRVQLGWVIFLFNLVLLGILGALGIILLKSAFQLTSLLFIIYGLWLVSNAVAFYISGNVRDILDILERSAALPEGAYEKLHFSELHRFADRLNAAYKAVETQSKLAAVGELSAQVAHDIRSPLAALDSALKDVSSLPEEKRLLIRGAAGRIRDIANSLLEKNRQARTTAQAADSADALRGDPPAVLLLSSLAEAAVTEKRLQFRDRMGVAIDSLFDGASYGVFARVQPVEFGRVLSNLINNAVEAVGRKGTVTLGLARDGGAAVLSVRDTGKGIPPELLARLGARGETHGKEGGSGLGLYHAMKTLRAWGGELRLASAPGQGTTAEIRLPLEPHPAWFVPELALGAGSSVVVLDDDTNIHQVWKGRFDSSRVFERGVCAVNFSEPDGLRDWVRSAGGAAAKAVYLFDYELLGRRETGLSLAEELGVAARTVLVTSRYEERHILDACQRLGIRLIPKNLANIVPISVVPAAAAPAARLAALLDDDPLAHMTWKLAAGRAGVELRAYARPDEFLSGVGELPAATPLYIDSELGGGVKGEEIAAQLRGRGYSDITLVTGHPPEKFAGLGWLKVADKQPPWA